MQHPHTYSFKRNRAGGDVKGDPKHRLSRVDVGDGVGVDQGEVEQAVKRHGDADVEWSLQGMLRLAPPAMRRLFAPTLVSIRQAIGDVLNHPNTRGKAIVHL